MMSGNVRAKGGGLVQLPNDSGETGLNRRWAGLDWTHCTADFEEASPEQRMRCNDKPAYGRYVVAGGKD